ncbi:DUF1064 domain-containing protein [Eubacterium sp. LFL-14]|jgi:transcriptional regulator with XRE-family HTH domain|uniref:DUF1064 domain-containing protein n=1 Tax=Eubacterium album TaxID=2978477 RepID=A0ABT2LWZ8_9FIRM|nr:DUF1064 domain-containing protein [Eubacterium sp. LFL-14]MCT7397700.1 DUF1064 domain-containing protein [Eubacterium sp. LFL-14]
MVLCSNGEFLHDFRVQHNISLQQVSKDTGIPEIKIKQWEEGVNIPSKWYLKTLTDYYHCTLSDTHKSSNKYRNQKVMVDGIMFDSLKEANRYQELKILEKSGRIKNLQRQVKYVLIPKQENERAVNYIADFVYEENDNLVVEDTKGVKTKEYIIKRKLMLYIHGIKIKEV